MHSSLSKSKETGRVVIGWAWEGVAMTHRPVVRGPDKPSQALTLEGIVDASSGRLPGKLQAADEKEEQHLAFSERGRRARTQCPFFLMQAIFVQPFIRFFFLLS